MKISKYRLAKFRMLVKGDVKLYNEIYGSHTSTFKILFSYRMFPILLIRITWLFSNSLIGKLSSLINILLFKIEYTSKCYIAKGLFFPHPNNIVIGASYIGSNCIIYHNVTLGAKYLDINFIREVRPIIAGSNVIGTGSVIIGPYRVEKNIKIGPNMLLKT